MGTAFKKRIGNKKNQVQILTEPLMKYKPLTPKEIEEIRKKKKIPQYTYVYYQHIINNGGKIK